MNPLGQLRRDWVVKHSRAHHKAIKLLALFFLFTLMKTFRVVLIAQSSATLLLSSSQEFFLRTSRRLFSRQSKNVRKRASISMARSRVNRRFACLVASLSIYWNLRATTHWPGCNFEHVFECHERERFSNGKIAQFSTSTKLHLNKRN